MKATPKSKSAKSSKATKSAASQRNWSALFDGFEDLDVVLDELKEEEEEEDWTEMESFVGKIATKEPTRAKRLAKKDAMKNIKQEEKKTKRVRKVSSDQAFRMEGGAKVWRNELGRFHRTDGPAFIDASGNQRWYLNNQCHREDGPAFIGVDGTKQWYLRGKRHRADGPAFEYPNGDYIWSTDGVISRPNQEGPAQRLHGRSYWFDAGGQYHRVGGPALDSEDQKWWYSHGKLHRMDGPAVEFTDGHKEYWLNGIKLSFEEFQKQTQTQVQPQPSSSRVRAVDFLSMPEVWKELSPLLARCHSSIFPTWNQQKSSVNGLERSEREIRELLEDLRVSEPRIEGGTSVISWWSRRAPNTRHRLNGPAVGKVNTDFLRYGHESFKFPYYLDGTQFDKPSWEQTRKATTSVLSTEIQAATSTLAQMNDRIEAANKLLEEKLASLKKTKADVALKQQELAKQAAANQAVSLDLLRQQILAEIKTQLAADNAAPYDSYHTAPIFDDWYEHMAVYLVPEHPYPSELLITVLNMFSLGEIEIEDDVEMEEQILAFSRLPIKDLQLLYHDTLERGKARSIDVLTVAKDNQTFDEPNFHSELTAAGYRIAATQITNLTKTLLVKAIPEDKLPTINSVMDSEIGAGLIALMAGWGLTYAAPDNDKAQTLAHEFRIRGLATFGNAAMDSLMGSVFDAIKSAVNDLPAEIPAETISPKETEAPITSTEISQAEDAIVSPSEVVETPTVLLDELDELEEAVMLQAHDKDLSIN